MKLELILIVLQVDDDTDTDDTATTTDDGQDLLGLNNTIWHDQLSPRLSFP